MNDIIKILLVVTLSFVSQLLSAQVINFDSYNRITDNSFQSFVNLFEKKNLPLTTDYLLSNKVLNPKSSRRDIPFDLVDIYLKDKGEYIPPPAFININESGEQDSIYGDFTPLYYLPTNGDYVLLAILRDVPSGDANKNVWVYAYDLQGNFIYTVAWMVMDGLAYVSGELNEQLQFIYTYLADYQGEYFDCDPCTEELKTLIYQTNSDGRQTEIDFITSTAEVEFCESELRFKKVN